MRRPSLPIAAAIAVLLIAFAGGYGYHRDELYFLVAGDHLAWGYADQGPLTPAIARAMSELAPDSLTVLRVPSALMAGGVVLLTGLIARELGASRRAELIAAACAAVSAIVLFNGHLLSTSTFDLLAWTLLTWLAVRAVRSGDRRLWLVAGAVLGLGLLNKPLPAFLALGLLAGVLAAGPRRLLRDRFVWGGAAIALALWAPWLIWQADHGWPQIDVSRSIAEGGSASSEPWWAVVPFQVLLFGPPLAAVWIAGLMRLLRDPGLRDVRFLGVGWLVLAVVFMASGGKPYYLAGLGPALLATGAISVDAWLERGRETVRRAALIAAVVVSGAVAAIISLPILPEDELDPVVAMNEDVGETVGWPEFAEQIAAVADELPTGSEPIVFAGNYGEAGALERYGPALGIDRVYSGHNGYWEWGPPTDDGAPVIVVGYGPAGPPELEGCVAAAQIEPPFGIDNDEEGGAVVVCDAPRGGWAEVWRRIAHLN